MDSKTPSPLNTPFEKVIVEILTEEAGGHGDHWEIFFDDLTRLGEILRRSIEEGDRALTYADNCRATPYPFPEREPQGVLLVWPIPRFGLIVALERDVRSRVSHFISAYPWVSEGVQHTVRLKQIRLWPNRLEAQIEGLVGPQEEMPITFFDPLFAADRVFYKKDELYQFILVGFPYRFEIVEPTPIIIRDSAEVRRLRNLLYSNDPEQRNNQEPIVFETKCMIALLPRNDLGVDDYDFHGPIKSVEEFHTEMLGQRTWLVRLTVARLADKDVDMDLCLTQKVKGDSRLPQHW